MSNFLSAAVSRKCPRCPPTHRPRRVRQEYRPRRIDHERRLRTSAQDTNAETAPWKSSKATCVPALHAPNPSEIQTHSQNKTLSINNTAKPPYKPLCYKHDSENEKRSSRSYAKRRWIRTSPSLPTRLITPLLPFGFHVTAGGRFPLGAHDARPGNQSKQIGILVQPTILRALNIACASTSTSSKVL
jgi:hypothetical protein